GKAIVWIVAHLCSRQIPRQGAERGSNPKIAQLCEHPRVVLIELSARIAKNIGGVAAFLANARERALDFLALLVVRQPGYDAMSHGMWRELHAASFHGSHFVPSGRL